MLLAIFLCRFCFSSFLLFGVSVFCLSAVRFFAFLPSASFRHSFLMLFAFVFIYFSARGLFTFFFFW